MSAQQTPLGRAAQRAAEDSSERGFLQHALLILRIIYVQFPWSLQKCLPEKIPVGLLFVSCGCANKLPQTWWLTTAQTRYFSVLKVGGLMGLKHPQCHGAAFFLGALGRPFLLPFPASRGCPHSLLCALVFKARSGLQSLSQDAVFGLNLLPPSCPPRPCSECLCPSQLMAPLIPSIVSVLPCRATF